MTPEDLQEFCDKHNITGYRLAKLMGVPTQQVYQYLNGKSGIPNLLEKMLEYLSYWLERHPEAKRDGRRRR